MQDLTIDCWIVCVTGFGQREGTLTGLERLHDLLRRQCASADTVVLLKSWKDNANDVAERIWRRRPAFGQPRVILIGYSLGGNTAIKIAKELELRGICVEELLLVDAVWWLWQKLPSLLSLLPFWVLRVPEKVKHIYVWRQKFDYPRGHDVATCRRTLRTDRSVSRGHKTMDDEDDVRETALRIACPNGKI